MNKFFAVFCLLLCAATLQAKDKPNPTDSNIKIHISASQLTHTTTSPYLVADALLNGKKVKLGGFIRGNHEIAYKEWVINPGDYQIRLKKDESENGGSLIRQEYEILLSNGETWDCWIVGISE
jgi:hypothetical protein